MRAPGVTTTADGPGRHRARTTSCASPRSRWRRSASREHPLASSDRALLEALVAGLAAAIDRLRLRDRGARRAHRRAGRPHAVGVPVRGDAQPPHPAGIDQGGVVDAAARRDLDLSADDRAELLDTIYDETERLERLVTNILELSRIRAGGLEVRRQPVDLRDLAQAAVRRLRPLARAHRVRLDVPPTFGDVEVDVQMMEQVFGNLLENALRFAPPGSEILVSCCPGRRRADVEVRVADHGPGVPEAERDARSSRSSRASTRDPTPAAPASASRSCTRS